MPARPASRASISNGFTRFMSSLTIRRGSALDEVELFPWPDGGAVRDQRRHTRVLRRHVVAVRVRPQADAAVRVVDEGERLPLADRRTARDQRCGARVLGGDVLVVGVGAQRDRAAALVDLVEPLRPAPPPPPPPPPAPPPPPPPPPPS